MTRYRKLYTTLMFLTVTTLAGVAVASTPALAGPGGIPGPNPDAPGQIKNATGQQGQNSPLVIQSEGSFAFAGKVETDASGQ
jgi:hypothetical protein